MTPSESHEHETSPPFLRRVVLRNYRSIAACDVRLGNLTFLVGPNGSGKSNFLDALRFVTDALRNSLDYAVRERGGVDELLHRTAGPSARFGIRLDFIHPFWGTGHYAFSIRPRSSGGYDTDREECVLDGGEGSRTLPMFFRRHNQSIDTSAKMTPPPIPWRLYLDLSEFRSIYDALSQMGFYNINPDQLRDLQPPDASALLARDGSNITTVLLSIQRLRPEVLHRVEQYLAAIVPGLQHVEVRTFGSRQTLEFVQRAGVQPLSRFPAASMSDGTLRALGILAALFQGGHVSLVGIEEPEAALHPAAVGVLLDALCEASAQTQVVVTSHSSDLLDSHEIPSDAILAVSMNEGRTAIGPIDDVGRSILRDHLYSAGELMRQNQLHPDAKAVEAGEHARLFDDSADAW